MKNFGKTLSPKGKNEKKKFSFVYLFDYLIHLFQCQKKISNKIKND